MHKMILYFFYLVRYALSARIYRIIVALFVFLLGECLSLPGVFGQSDLKQLAQNFTGYKIFLRPTEYKNYLEFNESQLKPIVKLTISYCPINNGELGKEKVYETLWYRGSNPIGCRRYEDLDIESNQQILVTLVSCTDTEKGAATNALVRLLFDATLNKNRITAVEVPSEIFSSLLYQFENENFYLSNRLPFTPAIFTALTLIDSIGDTEMVIFAGT